MTHTYNKIVIYNVITALTIIIPTLDRYDSPHILVNAKLNGVVERQIGEKSPNMSTCP